MTMSKKDEEKPLPLGTRVYEKHRKILKKWSGRLEVSEAEINRRAIEEFDKNRS